MEEQIQIRRLKNGMRVIHLGSKSSVAHLGVFVNAGTRDENDTNRGVAHFTEHMMFKGTTSRRSHNIINRVEEVGGELNAYTTKEDTCIYATFLPEYYERTIEVFSDVVLNSTFPEEEIRKEKEIVVDEINSYQDSPSELIFDEFEELIFQGNPLSHNILGSIDAVRDINQKTIVDFVSSTYNPENVVLSSVGDISFEKLCKWADKYFSDWERVRTYERMYVKRQSYNAQKVIKDRNTYQTHCMIGGLAYSQKNSRRYALGLLTNLLGGVAMNSKLNLALREKYGYAYNTEANYTPYSDTGIFSIYFGTDASNYVKCMNIVKKELDTLCKNKLSDLALRKVKKQLIGQMMISEASGESTMFSLGKSLLTYDKAVPMTTIYKRIERMSSNLIWEVANDIFAPEKLSMLVYN